MRSESNEADESGLTDSVWAVVAGAAKALEQPIDYIINEMSYANMLLYTASLPTYQKTDKGENKGKPDTDIVRADDPKNRDIVRKMIEES